MGRLVKNLLRYFNFIILILVLLIFVWCYRFLGNFHSKEFYEIDLKLLKDQIKYSECNCRNEEINLEFKNEEYSIQIKKSNSILKKYTIESNEFKYSNLACDPYKVFRRGKNQKVISYSVYGSNPFYFRYLKLIQKTAKKLFPDWTVRFYHDNTFSSKTICDIECAKEETSDEYLDNVDFCNIEKLPYLNWNAKFLIPTFWRWLPVGEIFVDVFLSRDSDFCLVQRDQAAVEDWLNSNTLFHIMRGNLINEFYASLT